MDSDKEVFLKHKNNIIEEYGKEALDSDVCNKIGKQYFKNNWGGCVSWNNVHIARNKYFVVNTSSSHHNHPGIHWMGLVTIGKHAYLWDSFNRSVKKLLPHLVHRLIKHGYKLGDTNHLMDQIGHTSQVCGHESLAFLMTVRDIGIERAKHV